MKDKYDFIHGCDTHRKGSPTSDEITGWIACFLMGLIVGYVISL